MTTSTTQSHTLRVTLIWFVVSLLMVLHFFLLLSVGVITTQLRTSLGLSALQLSFLSSSYLYIYLALQTPAGILLDQFGARKLLTVGSIVCSLGCYFFSQSQSLAFAMISRIMMGGGLAFVFISSIQLASRWFAPRYFGMMIGFSEAAGMAGSIMGNMMLAIFILHVGWRNSFIYAAILAMILALLSWLWIRDHPNKHGIPERTKLTVAKVVANIKFLVREPQIWLQSTYIALMYVTITVFSGLWANPFLRRAFDMNLQQATFSCGLVLAGIGLGSPLAGVFCHSMQDRIKCIKACAIAMLILMCAVLYITNLPFALINLLMFGLGVAGSSLVLSFAIVSDIAPEGAKSTSVGLTNTFSLISAIVFQPLVGWLLSLLSNSRNEEGLEYYSATDYRMALSILPVLLLIAFGISLLISNKFKRAKKTIK